MDSEIPLRESLNPSAVFEFSKLIMYCHNSTWIDQINIYIKYILVNIIIVYIMTPNTLYCYIMIYKHTYLYIIIYLYIIKYKINNKTISKTNKHKKNTKEWHITKTRPIQQNTFPFRKRLNIIFLFWQWPNIMCHNSTTWNPLMCIEQEHMLFIEFSDRIK